MNNRVNKIQIELESLLAENYELQKTSEASSSNSKISLTEDMTQVLEAGPTIPQERKTFQISTWSQDIELEGVDLFSKAKSYKN